MRPSKTQKMAERLYNVSLNAGGRYSSWPWRALAKFVLREIARAKREASCGHAKPKAARWIYWQLGKALDRVCGRYNDWWYVNKWVSWSERARMTAAEYKANGYRRLTRKQVIAYYGKEAVK
jgi:hypothetical protein